MTPATEALLQQLQNAWRLIQQQSRELDRQAQEVFAAIGERERALKNHDAYAVAVALDAIEDLIFKQRTIDR